MANITGFSSADFLDGTSANDDIRGLDGNDNIRGLDGNDIVNGNRDNDVVNGNAGSDTVYGGQGNDTVYGGQDNDLVFGNDGNDLVNGNAGNDTVYGGKDDDVVRGGQDNDLVSGDLGNDTLYGDLGVDTLTGGSGSDLFVLKSGTGSDTITDFVDGTDLIALDGLTSSDLTISSNGGSTNIFKGSELLGVITGVAAGNITAADFVPINTPAPIPGAGTLTFGGSNFNVNENGTPVTQVTVTRSSGSTGAVTATITLTDGTAFGGAPALISPEDYDNTSIVVNFATGETSKLVTIPILDDTLAESNETVNLSLGSPTGGASIGAQSTATLTIIDNDSNPTVTIQASDPNASESPTSSPDPGTFTISRTGSTVNALTVTYSVSGLATSGTDYNALSGSSNTGGVISGSITIPAGDTSINLTVTPIVDNTPDGSGVGIDEAVVVGITTNVSYNVGSSGSATVTIGDINGGSGNDVLTGADGNDTLTGGSGNDTLTGGLGVSDVYVYNASTEGIDVIKDFVAGADFLRISAAGFGGGLVAGSALLGTQFLSGSGVTAAATADQRFLYDMTTGTLRFDVDGTGGTASQTLAILTGAPSITTSNFTIF